MRGDRCFRRSDVIAAWLMIVLVLGGGVVATVLLVLGVGWPWGAAE